MYVPIVLIGALNWCWGYCWGDHQIASRIDMTRCKLQDWTSGEKWSWSWALALVLDLTKQGAHHHTSPLLSQLQSAVTLQTFTGEDYCEDVRCSWDKGSSWCGGPVCLCRGTRHMHTHRVHSKCQSIASNSVIFRTVDVQWWDTLQICAKWPQQQMFPSYLFSHGAQYPQWEYLACPDQCVRTGCLVYCIHCTI